MRFFIFAEFRPFLAVLVAAAGGLCGNVSAQTGASLSGPASAEKRPGFTLRTGEIDGSLFTIARPAEWNRRVLLLAHGQVPEDAPKQAGLDPTDSGYAHLLATGWLIASTSYRRNGLIVRDAIADLNALRDHIERTEGRPALVLLKGISMGGTIVTLMAENHADRYQGALAIALATRARDAEHPLEFSHAPKVPVLFLSNRSELDDPERYVDRVSPDALAPALWRIERDGHANVNAAEKAAALDALIRWVDTGAIERLRDGTLHPTVSAPAARIDQGVALGQVAQLTDTHGNLFTTFRPGDFARIGIAVGDSFELTGGGRTLTVKYGTTYSDVPRGEWVAFLRAEGVILIARNFANAAETLGLQQGDTLRVRALPKP